MAGMTQDQAEALLKYVERLEQMDWQRAEAIQAHGGADLSRALNILIDLAEGV